MSTKPCRKQKYPNTECAQVNHVTLAHGIHPSRPHMEQSNTKHRRKVMCPSGAHVRTATMTCPGCTAKARWMEALAVQAMVVADKGIGLVRSDVRPPMVRHSDVVVLNFVSVVYKPMPFQWTYCWRRRKAAFSAWKTWSGANGPTNWHSSVETKSWLLARPCYRISRRANHGNFIILVWFSLNTSTRPLLFHSLKNWRIFVLIYLKLMLCRYKRSSPWCQ